MYSVYVDGTCIYDDTSTEKSLRLINPVLELSDSAAGCFKMTVPVTNIGYRFINRMTSDVVIYKDEEEIWMGRVIDESIDFWKNRSLTCEGELAFLNDSTQPPADYHDISARGYLESIIAIHNAHAPVNRRFIVGNVTVEEADESVHRYTNYEKTIECINTTLLQRLGGHLIIRKEDGLRYLDYLIDKDDICAQTIEFGTNLLDYAASYDMTGFATVIVPLGKKLDSSPIQDLDAYLTVASVNEGSIYVQNAEAVENYGWIEQVVHFDEVEVASELLQKAYQYLSLVQFNSLILEVKALDLHYLNPEIESVHITDQIRVVSLPHGLDKLFPVVKLSIPLDQPENTQFTLGTNVTTTLTSVNDKTNSDIIQQINSMPTRQNIADIAQESASSATTSMVLASSATSSGITIPDKDAGSFAPWASHTPGNEATAYNFRNDNGWIISTNEGINNSYSYGTLSFNFSESTNIIVRCECKAKPSTSGLLSTDYGLISNLDTELAHTNMADITGVKYSFYNKAYGHCEELTYTVPSGSHYITFKFIKDASNSDPIEYLKLRAFTVKTITGSGTSSISLSGTGSSASTATIHFPGIPNYDGLASIGDGVVNGSNIQNGSVNVAKLDLTELRMQRVYLGSNVYLWYDSTAGKLKINVNGTDTIVSTAS